MDNVFVPIFKKDGNRFFILIEEFVGKDELEATQIGLGAMLVECVICRMSFTGEVQEINLKNTPHALAQLGPLPVAIVSGPAFDERIEALEEKSK